MSRSSDLRFETCAETYPARSARQRCTGVSENIGKKDMSPSSTYQGERLQRLMVVSPRVRSRDGSRLILETDGGSPLRSTT